MSEELKRIALLANVLLLGPSRWDFGSGEEWARAGVAWYLEHWGDESLRVLPQGCSTVAAARAWLELASWAAHEPLPQLFAEQGEFVRAYERWWAQLPEGAVEAANPYGCNRYGHYCPQKGTTREGETRPKNTAATGKEQYVSAEPAVVAVKDEMQNERDMEQAMKKRRDMMSRQAGSKRAPNHNGGSIAPGMDVAFYITGTTIGECKNKVGDSADEVSHYTAASHVDALWEQSVPLAVEGDRYNEPSVSKIKNVYKRLARMRIRDQLYSVKITAKEFKSKDILPIFYTVKTEKIRA